MSYVVQLHYEDVEFYYVVTPYGRRYAQREPRSDVGQLLILCDGLRKRGYQPTMKNIQEEIRFSVEGEAHLAKKLPPPLCHWWNQTREQHKQLLDRLDSWLEVARSMLMLERDTFPVPGCTRKYLGYTPRDVRAFGSYKVANETIDTFEKQPDGELCCSCGRHEVHKECVEPKPKREGWRKLFCCFL
jgi:hypothetical protein